MNNDMASSIKPIERQKVSLAIAAQLQQILLSGEYQAGDKLPSERVLGERFGVGRSSIREALRRLEAEGLVRIVHGVGSFVGDGPEADSGGNLARFLVLDGSTVPELFEVRRALEGETAARAAERLTASEANELRKILRQLEDKTLSDEVYVEADVALHLTIARATKNTPLIRLLESFEGTLVEYSRRVIKLPGRRERANEGHRAMVEAILARSPSAAYEAVINHIEVVERDIMQHLEKEGTESHVARGAFDAK